MLYFLDDGSGMDSQEAVDAIISERSTKESRGESGLIGMYGNGMKSGSMRISEDMLVFTKKNGTLTCALLSRNFMEAEGLSSIIVPAPAFDERMLQPINPGEWRDTEMDLIKKYSPFKCDENLLGQFNLITAKSGTLVVCYNLHLKPNGETELSFTDTDIVLSDGNSNIGIDACTSTGYPEKRSFAAYAAILYRDQRMRIYVQHKKVKTACLLDNLYKPCRILCPSKYLLEFEKQEAVLKRQSCTAGDALDGTHAVLSECQLETRDITTGSPQHQQAPMGDDLRLPSYLMVKETHYEQNTEYLDVKGLKMIKLYFGINLTDRRRDGLFIYNAGRLIKMYEPAVLPGESLSDSAGIVGIVDVSYSFLEPTPDKQDFSNPIQFGKLKNLMFDGMKLYVQVLQGMLCCGFEFMWKSFGYLVPNWDMPPSNEEQYVRKRMCAIHRTPQCKKCIQWRRQARGSRMTGDKKVGNA